MRKLCTCDLPISQDRQLSEVHSNALLSLSSQKKMQLFSSWQLDLWVLAKHRVQERRSALLVANNQKYIRPLLLKQHALRSDAEAAARVAVPGEIAGRTKAVRAAKSVRKKLGAAQRLVICADNQAPVRASGLAIRCLDQRAEQEQIAQI